MCKRLFYLLIVLVFALTPASRAQTDDPSLAAWWRLDEGGGTAVVDASGNGNDGTLNGGATRVPGTSKGGVYLDGVDDFIGVPNVLGETSTLAFWFKPDWDGSDPEDYRLFDASLGGIYFFISKGANHADINPEEFGFYLEDASDADYQGIEFDPAGVIFADTWFHVAVTWEFGGGSAVLYFNGEEMARADNIGGFPSLDPTLRFGLETYAYIPMAHGAQGVIDEIMIYDRVFAADEIPLLMVTAPAELASDPDPADEATDVVRDLTVGWVPGEFAVKHDVYLGTSADDVNDASRANPLDVLVSQGQDALAYDVGRLELGQTYYWRVDEVNGTPDNTIFTGEVWSFTVEPLAYPIQGVVATCNVASDPGLGLERTVDGSGLNAADEHSTTAEDMWLAAAGADPVQLVYEFDRVYKLHEMQVWNYNVQFELILGFGLKDVTVEYSENGADWTTLGEFEFAQAAAKATYQANTIVDFAGAPVKYVRLTVNSGWGLMGQYGLSEVRFLHIPAFAREPEPVDSGAEVLVDSTLSWRAGREAATHDIYFGSDPNALALAGSVDTASFTPANLEFGMTYYWQVDEVNEAEAITTWPGNLWSFATQEFALIEGFEEYDDEDNRIYDTWLDGWVNDTGSLVGYLEAPFAEQSIVHGGRQSMPLIYDNSVAPFHSEAEKDLGGANWTGNGADTLRLFVGGLAPQFYEGADGTILMNGIGTDIWDTADQFRYVYKSLSGNGSMTALVVDLDETPNEWVKAGVMIRQGTGTGSQHSFMAITGGGGNGASWQGRPAEGQASVNEDVGDAVTTPYWVKIERTGNSFSGFISPDGQTWTQVGEPREVVMQDPVLIGLALTSHNASQATSAEFANVSFTGNVAGNWQIEEIGAAQPEGNVPESLYVAVEDASGKIAVITHPDEAITARSGWTEWRIPYSDLTGVDLARVGRLIIGVGNRDNPSAGGSGTIFIDDLGFGRPAASE